MFSSLIDRFRTKPDPGRAPRRAEALGDIVAGTFADRPESSFQRVGSLSWAGEASDHIRCLLKFQEMKGMTYSACWGVSIDFVPFLGNRTLRPKRTAKSANFDLCIDPIDTSDQAPGWCSLNSNDGADRVERVASAVLKAAKADWAQITSLEDVADSFERRSRMKFRRFSLENYVQTDLAWGLVLIATGDSDPGQRRLDAFCETFGVAADTAILAKAKTEAAAIAAAR